MILTANRTNKNPVFEWWRSVDRVMVSLFIVLLLAGMVLSMAASPNASAKLGISNPFYFFSRHFTFVAMGVTGAIIVSLMSPTNARRIGVLALLGSIIALMLIPFIGTEVKGATRWIRFAGLSLQPSEFAKPGFIVFAAWMFAHRKRDIRFPGMAFVLGLYLLLIMLLIRQPDFGQSFLLTVIFGAMFFYAGLSAAWIIGLGLSAMVAGVGAYFALPHVQSRIQRFLDPEGSDTYQTDKALEAIANGGIFGQGPGGGEVSRRLPDAHTDFIFALAVEEFGFILSFLLIAVLAALVFQAFRKALRLHDHFAQMAVAGLATMIGVQTVINLAVNLNMVPPKGMTLPFISSGGSSMLAMSFSVGLILAFTRRRPGFYGYGDT